MMVCLPVIKCCINKWNNMSNMSNYLCLRNAIHLRYVNLMFWTISPMMLSTTSPTLQRLPTIAFALLLKMRVVSSINYIECLEWSCIILVTCIVRNSSFLIPLYFSLVIPFTITFSNDRGPLYSI